MKIWGNIPGVSGVYNKQGGVRKTEKTSGIASRKDDISISKQAKDFQSAMKALKEIPDIRQDKVDEISRKIESGSYNVSGKEIAEKITKSILDKRV